jgi:hypothetical protein
VAIADFKTCFYEGHLLSGTRTHLRFAEPLPDVEMIAEQIAGAVERK